MAVFRVAKSSGFTVMSNYHLRDKNLSCKACGLLSKMLSLPDEWDYTTRGLASICKDGVDSITTALKELEACGYLIRSRRRDEKGRVADTEFIIYEHPRNLANDEPEVESFPSRSEAPDPASPDPDSPDREFPGQESPNQDTPDQEIPAEINKERSNTEKTSTEESNTQKTNTDSLSKESKNPPPPLPAREQPENAPVENFTGDGTEEDEEDERQPLSPARARKRIREQIDYDHLRDRVNTVQLDELVELMLEVKINRSPTVRISREEEFPASYVRARFDRISMEHVESVLESMRENSSRVKSTKAYLLAALFNSVSTLDNHYAMMANADLNGG